MNHKEREAPQCRFRVDKTFSFGDAGVLPPACLGPPPSAATAKRKEKSVKSPPRILTRSCPVQGNVDVSDEEPIVVFLDKCYYC
ncbi:hypothetical protein Acr_28g0004160 [Actinidia rufa]|uniref:Uncharacterized protein n=1 Tax=Actinidia rufa TaxID=165716 RepID=A0A7J0H9S9_9ERIC|nr:hypothetical protein Acr_28g0004160 [Actinidia rufa]